MRKRYKKTSKRAPKNLEPKNGKKRENSETENQVNQVDEESYLDCDFIFFRGFCFCCCCCFLFCFVLFCFQFLLLWLKFKLLFLKNYKEKERREGRRKGNEDFFGWFFSVERTRIMRKHFVVFVVGCWKNILVHLFIYSCIYFSLFLKNLKTESCYEFVFEVKQYREHEKKSFCVFKNITFKIDFKSQVTHDQK